MVVFAARFMPGLRAPIFATCGITKKVSYIKFLSVDGFAALISVPVWVYLGFWAEYQFNSLAALENYIKTGQMSIGILLGILVLVLLILWQVKRRVHKKLRNSSK